MSTYMASGRPHRTPDPMNCAQCGLEFTPFAMARNQKYCSNNCKQMARYARKNPKVQRDCLECKVDITQMRSDAKFCSNECAAKFNNRNKAPEHRRRNRLSSKYGMTPEDYDALVEAQGGKCAICHKPDPETKHGFWHIDHCHKTGKVRGLLCSTCNTALGSFFDNPAVIINAAAYLLKHGAI